MKNKESTELLNQLLRGELPDENGRFGPFGGQFAPETLMPALKKLEKGVKQFLNDDSFRDELTGNCSNGQADPLASHSLAS